MEADLKTSPSPSPIRILTFTGASGAGKTTLVDALMQNRPELERVISCTTRPRRESDPKGEYAYLSDDEFKMYRQKNAFLWEGEYASQRYGTLKKSVSDALEAKYPRIMTLTPDKTALLRSLHPSQVLSFLIVCPQEDVIRERLLDRGANPSDIERRIASNRETEKHVSDSSVSYIRISTLKRTTAQSLAALLKILNHSIA
jgi:guanylate kinase